MMLKDEIMEKVLNSESAIEINQSRCLRMRLNTSSCNKCVDSCHAGAISIAERITINRDACSECMLCISECPSGCLKTNAFDFYSIVGRLKKIQSLFLSPVLSCNTMNGLDAHAKTCCIGFLSEEHIIALSIFLKGTLQINLTECTGCINASTVGILKKRLEVITKKTSIDPYDKIRLIEDKADLDYKEDPYDRREFFTTLKNLTLQKTADFLDNRSKERGSPPYSEKALPYKRDLLNKVIGVISKGYKKELLRNYYYGIAIDESCDNCLACTGMCPTGALKAEKGESELTLLFNSSLCIGCGLCKDFCMNDSISIERGFSKGDVFEFHSARAS